MSQEKTIQTPSSPDRKRRETAKTNIPAVKEAAGTDITDASDLLDLDQNAKESIPEMSVGRKQKQRRCKSEMEISESKKEE